MSIKVITPKTSRFESSDKVEVARKVPILSIFPEPRRLRQAGNKYIACCPLHEDNNPSMVIYLETNTWFCFSGCGGGDVIDFLMRLYNIDFREALERLQK